MKKYSMYLGALVLLVVFGGYFVWQYYQTNIEFSQSGATAKLQLVCGNTSCPGSSTSDNPKIKQAISCIDQKLNWKGKFSESITVDDDLAPHAGGACSLDGPTEINGVRLCAVYAFDAALDYVKARRAKAAAASCGAIGYLVDKNGDAILGGFLRPKSYSHLHLELKDSTDSCGCKWTNVSGPSSSPTPAASPTAIPSVSASVSSGPSTYPALPLSQIYPSKESLLKYPLTYLDASTVPAPRSLTENVFARFTTYGGQNRPGPTETISWSVSKIAWTISSGFLPQGLKLYTGIGADSSQKSSWAEVRGIPSQIGTFDFKLKATDSDGASKTQDYSIVVQAPKNAPMLSDGLLADCENKVDCIEGSKGPLNGFTKTNFLRPATINKVYGNTIRAFGMVLPLKWSVAKGALPEGFRFISEPDSFGLSFGAEKVTAPAGLYNFTIKATDSLGKTATKDYAIRVYSQNPLRLAIEAPWVGGGGEDKSQRFFNYYLPAGVVGKEYKAYHKDAFGSSDLSGDFTFKVFGGNGDYSLRLVSGSLPPGLSIVPMSCSLTSDRPCFNFKLSGTPTTQGNYTFELQGEERASSTVFVRREFYLAVRKIMPIKVYTQDETNWTFERYWNSSMVSETGKSLLYGMADRGFFVAFDTGGSSVPYSYSLSGSVPPGLQLKQDNKPISGGTAKGMIVARLSGVINSSAAGKTYDFMVIAQDSLGNYAQRRFSMFVKSMPPAMSWNASAHQGVSGTSPAGFFTPKSMNMYSAKPPMFQEGKTLSAVYGSSTLDGLYSEGAVVSRNSALDNSYSLKSGALPSGTRFENGLKVCAKEMSGGGCWHWFNLVGPLQKSGYYTFAIGAKDSRGYEEVEEFYLKVAPK